MCRGSTSFTLATTAVLVLLALAYPWRERAGGMADLAAVGVVSVIATPMAWEHHYGVMLPIFVWLWFGVYRAGCGSAWKLALAFVLIADFLSPFNFLAAIPVAECAAELHVLRRAAAAVAVDARSEAAERSLCQTCSNIYGCGSQRATRWQ